MHQKNHSGDDNNLVNKVNTVVLVGHCGFDQSSISRAVAAALPGCAIKSANTAEALEASAGPGTLLLINRVLDGRFNTGSGLDLIADLAGNDTSPKMMLISNYPESQEQAVQAGALPGFGKNDLSTPETIEKLKTA